jgi:hypothetical protein
MANVSKVILGAAIAAVSIASPALAAPKGKSTSAHQNGYVTQSSQGSGVRAFASVRVPVTIQRSPAAVALAIIKISALISGDVV